MIMHKLVLFVCTALLLSALHSNAAYKPVLKAHCKLEPTVKHGLLLNIEGEVTFENVYPDDIPEHALVRVKVDIQGMLGNAVYALHIHEYGDLTDKQNGMKAGDHFIGVGSYEHSCPPDPKRHEGDMGNWTAIGGYIQGWKDLDLLKLTGKEGSIVGRSVILHALPDNCTGPDGHAGPRLAQCVIGISNVDDNMACFEEEVMTAVAELTPTTHCEEHCSGTVWFFQMHNSVEVIAKVKGLEKDSVHGFHIHQYGDLRDEEGLSAGEHFNPNGRKHNLPPHTPRHMGDLGNIQSYDDEGHAWYRFFDHNIKDLSMLVGRGVIVHSDDDHGSGYLCDESGDSGNRLLMGVIGVAHPGTKAPTIPEDVDINNHWESSSCEDIVLDDHKGHSKGLVAALIVGWAIAGLLLLVVLPGLSIYYNRRLRHRYDTLGTIPE